MLQKIIKTIFSLRLFFLLFLTVGLFYYMGLNPVTLGKFVGAKMGSAVGVSMTVPENPMNKLALELRKKEENLNIRENQIQKREDDLNTQRMGTQMKLIIGLGIGIIVLFILIIFNFYLDYRRRRLAAPQQIKK